MKLSQTTLLAILATTAFTNAAPTASDYQTSTIVKREEINSVMEHLAELKNLRVKRDLTEDSDALIELERRADSVLGDLIGALLNSGIIGDVFHTLTTDPELRTSIFAIVKSAVQAALVQGPTLIKAVWNSGLIQDIFKKILDDGDLRSALLNAGKAIFKTALNLLQNFLGSRNSGDQAAAPAPQQRRGLEYNADSMMFKREALVDGEAIGERDLLDIVSFVVNQIKDSGLVSNLINKVLADPEATISFLSSALKNGLVLVEDVFGWAKSSGILDSGIKWLANSDNAIIHTLGSFLAGAIDSGDVSADEFDNAGGSATVATTKTATTAAAAAGTAPITAAAKATGGSDDLGFLSKYAQEGATTLYKKRMVY